MSGVLCLLWAEEVDVSIQNFSIHDIDANVYSNGKQWRFTGIYGQLDHNQRHETWELIRRLNDFNRVVWVLKGDFNEILWNSEKAGGPHRDQRLVHAFRRALDDCKFFDLGF